MSITTFNLVDVANYAAIARRMSPVGGALAICDCGGRLLAGSDDSVEGCLSLLRETAPDWPQRVQHLELLTANSNDAVLIMNLQSASNPAVGFLLWWITDTSLSSPGSDLHDTLMSLGTCIRNELELHTELDSMALELSERYEELNLVYATDDQVSYFREGYEAFRALTKNCAEYLNAGVAILYLRDKGLMIESCTKLKATEARAIREVLDDSLYDMVIQGGDVEFLNNDDEENAENVSLPYRIMVGSIISFGTKADGVLLIANSLSERPFSNSDKNLMAVMSRKAAKIVQCSYDGLTGLINRASFQNLLESELVDIRKNGGCHCVLHLNIDQLHRINETFGHEAGDMVIRSFAEKTAGDLRGSDWVARLGGDEIGILIRDSDADRGLQIAQKLLDKLADLHIEWQGEVLRMTASIGVATLIESSKSGEQALQNAVIACDLAREHGGNTANSYGGDESNMRKREAGMWMVSNVQRALREDLFLLYAQPIAPLKPHGQPHVEILLRMEHEDQILTPDAFLSASERYQLMIEIDQWVVRKSLEEIGRYLDSDPAIKPVFGINLSGQSLGNVEFQDFATNTLCDSGVPAELICFEITETAAVSNLRGAQKLIATLKSLGCKFALDDFGVGLSSFAYLKAFDVDYIKIDGALVRHIAEDRVSAAMVESVHQIAHVMGLETIAEFVETALLKKTLAQMGIDYAQGYFLGRPIPLRQQLGMMNSQVSDESEREDAVPQS